MKPTLIGRELEKYLENRELVLGQRSKVVVNKRTRRPVVKTGSGFVRLGNWKRGD